MSAGYPASVVLNHITINCATPHHFDIATFCHHLEKRSELMELNRIRTLQLKFITFF